MTLLVKEEVNKGLHFCSPETVDIIPDLGVVLLQVAQYRRIDEIPHAGDLLHHVHKNG